MLTAACLAVNPISTHTYIRNTTPTVLQVPAPVHECCAALVLHSRAHHHVPPGAAATGRLQDEGVPPACQLQRCIRLGEELPWQLYPFL
jgi:hypothetical protein